MTVQNVLVLGATGNVGTGAVHAFLKQGANVLVVSRTPEKLKKLEEEFKEHSKQIKGFIGHFDTEENVQKLKSQIVAHLGSAHLNHLVLSLGFIKIYGTPLTQSPLANVKDAFEDGFYPNYLGARYFAHLVEDVKGNSISVVSGGFSQIVPPTPDLWAGTIKGAAMNGLALSIASEFKNLVVSAPVIYFGVAKHGENKNQVGMDAVDTYDFGEYFSHVGKSGKSGQLHALKSLKDVQNLVKQWN